MYHLDDDTLGAILVHLMARDLTRVVPTCIRWMGTAVVTAHLKLQGTRYSDCSKDTGLHLLYLLSLTDGSWPPMIAALLNLPCNRDWLQRAVEHFTSRPATLQFMKDMGVRINRQVMDKSAGLVSWAKIVFVVLETEDDEAYFEALQQSYSPNPNEPACPFLSSRAFSKGRLYENLLRASLTVKDDESFQPAYNLSRTETTETQGAWHLPDLVNQPDWLSRIHSIGVVLWHTDGIFRAPGVWDRLEGFSRGKVLWRVKQPTSSTAAVSTSPSRMEIGLMDREKLIRLLQAEGLDVSGRSQSEILETALALKTSEDETFYDSDDWFPEPIGN